MRIYRYLAKSTGFQPIFGPENIELRGRQAKYSNKICELSPQTFF